MGFIIDPSSQDEPFKHREPSQTYHPLHPSSSRVDIVRSNLIISDILRACVIMTTTRQFAHTIEQIYLYLRTKRAERPLATREVISEGVIRMMINILTADFIIRTHKTVIRTVVTRYATT